MNEVTRVLPAIDQGDARANEPLFPLVYEEFRALAAQRLQREKPGRTLQATALGRHLGATHPVFHEAFVLAPSSDNCH
jgi:hypothetical protein